MALTASVEKELRSKVEALREVEDTRRAKAKRRNLWTYGSLVVVNATIAVFSIVTSNWDSLFINLINMAFISIIWMQETVIAEQHFVIRMQFGLRNIESEEIENIMSGDDGEAKAKKKAPVKKAKATK